MGLKEIKEKKHIRTHPFFSITHGNLDRYFSVMPIERRARCFQCGYVTASDPDLPFYRLRPEEAVDEYYCGCRGFD